MNRNGDLAIQRALLLLLAEPGLAASESQVEPRCASVANNRTGGRPPTNREFRASVFDAEEDGSDIQGAISVSYGALTHQVITRKLEVVIESERVGDPFVTHHLEADRVHQR